MSPRPGTPAPGSPENSLLQRARAGDLLAFEQLVRQHQIEVFAEALRLTGQHAAAVELAQDAFVQLRAAIARISSPAHLLHWLLRVVSQRAMERHWPQTDAPEPAATAADPGADFTARVMAHVELRWSHRRADFGPAGGSRKRGTRSRGVLIGVVAIIGAAALLALWSSGKLRSPATAAVATPEATPPDDAPKGTAPAVTADIARTAASSPLRPVASQDAYPHYTVIVLPLRQASPDPAAMAPVAAFHAALVAEMRKDPGLSLLFPGVTAPPDSLRSASYLLTVTSLEARPLPAGGTAFRITDNRGGGALSAGSPASGRQWPVEVRVQPIGQSQSAGFTSTLQVGEDSALLPALAARQMELLRVRMFPDVQVKQQVLARFRDPSLSAMERSNALNDLLGMQRDRGPGLDSIDIGVIVAGAAALPAAQRARLWRSLRGTSSADLVPTLIDSMRRDPDTGVRFEALATLVADYSTDSRVRAAIESASQEDSAEVMRMAARRARNGDGPWRNYIVSALRNTTLPYAERLAPLLLAGQSATTPAETLGMRTIMNDEEVVNLLAGMIRDSWFDYTQTQSIGDALGLLAGAANPAAVDLLVEIPQDNFRSGAAAAAAPMPMPALQISPAAMAWLQKNSNNPRARRILDDIARGNAGPQTGAMIEQMMQQRPPPPRRQ